MNRLHLPIAAVVALALLSAAPINLQAVDVAKAVVVVNKANTITTLTPAKIRDLLLARTSKWPDGQRVTLAFAEKESAERTAFLETYCKMSAREYDAMMFQAVFKGEIKAGPKVLGSAKALKEFVAGNANALGILAARDVDDSVKTISIQ
jgi:ABC-type phosphate transport system substrate-binding protein